MEKIDNDLVLNKIQWTTHMLMREGLVVHTSPYFPVIKLDKEHLCPDGLPTVVVEYKIVTRVRKMTDEELTQCMKKFGSKIEIDMRIHREEPDDEIHEEKK